MALQGWRVWQVFDRTLTSPVMGDWWLPGETMTAEACGWCKACRKHYWPNKDRCSCGIYSYVDPQECAWQSVWKLREGACVQGTVNLWGRTVPHQYGQRSLHARITGFYLWPDTPPAVIELLLKYPAPILQAADQPWWDPQYINGRAAGQTWHSKKRPPQPEKDA